jgi:hypothetical protein
MDQRYQDSVRSNRSSRICRDVTDEAQHQNNGQQNHANQGEQRRTLEAHDEIIRPALRSLGTFFLIPAYPGGYAKSRRPRGGRSCPGRHGQSSGLEFFLTRFVSELLRPPKSAGHASKRTLRDYSHIRMQTKRRARSLLKKSLKASSLGTPKIL